MTPDRLTQLGASVAAEQDVLLEQAAPSDSSREFVARRAVERAQRTPRRTERRWLHAAWLAPSLIVLGVWLGRGWIWTEGVDAPPLTFTVGDRAGVLQAWESAPSDRALSLDFSDGTSVLLASEARARVVAVDGQGAEIVLEAGRASVHVVPHPGQPAQYRVRTGPFVVAVKGTRFDVMWDPAAEDFSLQLYEGRVHVSGCGLGADREVLAGQRVSASCRRPGFELRAIEVASVEPPAPPPASLAPSSAAAQPEALRAARHAATHLSWRQLAREGRFQRAYAAAADAGFGRECARSDVDDVLLLGDAARHAGHSSEARRAYMMVRERAPGTAVAAGAAFALGRLALDDDPSLAAQWFEQSLAERPQGPLAQAARDRLLELAVQRGDPKQLRQSAERYLTQSPDGPHAAQARRILDRGESKP